MNDEDFEKKLIALTSGLERSDPTAAWKADILARARREAAALPSQRALPPRWLMLSWMAAWMAIVLLSWATPQSVDPSHSANLATGQEKLPTKSISEMDASPQTLIAYQRNFYTDNP